MATFRGTHGDDNISGTSGNDNFLLWQGGNDSVDAGDGNDIFRMGGALNAGDKLDGGAGTDYLILKGDYSGGVVFNDDTITNIEAIGLIAGHSYKLTLADGNVAAGERLLVKAGDLHAGDTLTFDGSAETDGNYAVIGGAGDDVLTGGAKHDAFNLTHGGNDTVHGGGGYDTFIMGAALTESDTIDGGAGNDTLVLDGDYSDGLVFAASTIAGIETISLANGHSYTLTTDDANVASGATLTVDGSALVGHDLSFDGSAETNGHFDIIGGTGDDLLFGGAKSDTFDLTRGGLKSAQGGGGDDTFNLGATFSAADNIDGDAGNDTVTLNGDYSAGFSFAANTMINVETLSLADGHSYNLATSDGTVAPGETLTVDATALTSGNVLIFDGSAETDGGTFIIAGGAGDDTLTGGADADGFDLSQGGNDTAHGGGGNDTFDFGGAFTASDTVDGGANSDAISLDGDYSAGVVFTATTMTNVEEIALTAGRSYKLTTADANVASGGALTVDASTLGAGDQLIFDGRAETNGQFNITGGAGDDTVKLNADALKHGTFDGGAGNDTLEFNGIVGTFSASMVQNVETLKIDDGQSVTNMACVDATVAAGATLTVDASALTGGNILDFFGNAETNGHFHVIGGAAIDTMLGGNLGDVFTGGGGADQFRYSTVAESTSTGYDTITDVNFGVDTIFLTYGGLTDPSAIDAAITTGALSTASFDGDLGTWVNNLTLAAHHAVLFTPDSGTLSGHTFLIVDLNGAAGYQSAGDLVIDVTGYAGTLTTGSFS
jgi:Ca2+-binding RTX toxin-like protein